VTVEGVEKWSVAFEYDQPFRVKVVKDKPVVSRSSAAMGSSASVPSVFAHLTLSTDVSLEPVGNPLDLTEPLVSNSVFSPDMSKKCFEELMKALV